MDKVEEIVDNCIQQDDVTDALGKNVPKETSDDAKMEVAALVYLLQAVYGTCKDVEGSDEIGQCAFKEGKQFCGASDFDKKDCMHGVMFVLKKVREIPWQTEE